jgi:hypothetical protein
MWNGGRGGGVPIETVRGAAMAIWLAVTERGVDWSRVGQGVDELHVPGQPSLDAAVAQCLTDLHVR